MLLADQLEMGDSLNPLLGFDSLAIVAPSAQGSLLLDYQFSIKRYNSRTARWKRRGRGVGGGGAGVWEGEELPY